MKEALKQFEEAIKNGTIEDGKTYINKVVNGETKFVEYNGGKKVQQFVETVKNHIAEIEANGDAKNIDIQSAFEDDEFITEVMRDTDIATQARYLIDILNGEETSIKQDDFKDMFYMVFEKMGFDTSTIKERIDEDEDYISEFTEAMCAYRMIKVHFEDKLKYKLSDYPFESENHFEFN